MHVFHISYKLQLGNIIKPYEYAKSVYIAFE